MTTLIVFLLTLAATLRLTRLAIHDAITRPFRDALASREARSAGTGWDPAGNRLPGPGPTQSHARWSMLRKLFDCPWCIGFWISLATAGAELHAANPVPTIPIALAYPALVLSLSWLVGVIDMAVYTLEVYEPGQRIHLYPKETP